MDMRHVYSCVRAVVACVCLCELRVCVKLTVLVSLFSLQGGTGWGLLALLLVIALGMTPPNGKNNNMRMSMLFSFGFLQVFVLVC